MNTEQCDTWVEISKRALKKNVEKIKNLLKPETKLLAVVKSNAYGHGLVQTSKLFLKYRADWLGVFSFGEAIELRKSGIRAPVLVMGPTHIENLKSALRHNLSVSISSMESIRHIPKGLKFHIKVDTGLSRQGFLWDKVDDAFRAFANHGLRPEGIFTHLADAQSSDTKYSLKQFDRFSMVLDSAQRHGFDAPFKHMIAADGLLTFPQGEFNMVRAGIALYGLPISAGWQEKFESIGFSPALSWKARISEVKKIPKGAYVGYDLTEKVKRDTNVAIIPVGYWDGYDRGLSSAGIVSIHGKRCKVLGRIAMNMIVVDASNAPEACAGDQCSLIGEQISATELAELANTINYEIVTRINPLIRRFYI